MYRVTRGLKARNPQGTDLLGGQGQNRTADTRIFSPLLYQLSYLAGWVIGAARLETHDQPAAERR